MNSEQWLKAAQLIVSFIQVIIWPGVLLFILIYFGSALKKFGSGSNEGEAVNSSAW
jgi:hypothetical protein